MAAGDCDDQGTKLCYCGEEKIKINKNKRVERRGEQTDKNAVVLHEFS